MCLSTTAATFYDDGRNNNEDDSDDADDNDVEDDDSVVVLFIPCPSILEARSGTLLSRLQTLASKDLQLQGHAT